MTIYDASIADYVVAFFMCGSWFVFSSIIKAVEDDLLKRIVKLEREIERLTGKEL